MKKKDSENKFYSLSAILKKNSSELIDELKLNQKLWLNEGSLYGEAGNHFIRINIACPLSTLKIGLQRMKEEFKSKQI